MAKDVELVMSADDQASAPIDLLKRKVDELNAKLEGSDRTTAQKSNDLLATANQKWIEMSKSVAKYAAAIQGARGVLAIATAGVEAYKGEWEKVEEAVKQLPFGIGTVYAVGRDLKETLSGAREELEALNDELQRSEERNRQAEKKLELQGWIDEQTKNRKARLAVSLASDDFEASLKQAQVDRDAAMAEVDKKMRGAEQDTGTIAKATALRSAVVAEYEQRVRKIWAEDIAKQNEEDAKRAQKDADAQRERADKIASLDAQLNEAHLRFLGKNYEAEVANIRSKYQVQIDEAKRANDAEMADKLAKMREADLDLAAMREVQGRKDDKDKSKTETFSPNTAFEARFATRAPAKTAEEQLSVMRQLAQVAAKQQQQLTTISNTLSNKFPTFYIGN